MHFYHLSAVDWVDVVSALDADPVTTSKLAESLSDWPLQRPARDEGGAAATEDLCRSGQLGPFASGFWGHPAMKLSPEVNLLGVAHYMNAFRCAELCQQDRRHPRRKEPAHPERRGRRVSNSISHDAPSVLNIERLMLIRTFIDKLEHFIKSTYLVDVPAIGAFYLDWTTIGGGVNNYLTVPDCPQDTKGTVFDLPGGYIANGDLKSLKPITTFNDAYFRDGVAESSKHAWYTGRRAPPWDGRPSRSTPTSGRGQVFWVKAPTFYGQRAEVGPLADVLVGVAVGNERYTRYLNGAIGTIKAVSGLSEVPLSALESTIGRHAARGALRGDDRYAEGPVAETGRQHRYRRPGHLQCAGIPKGEIRGVGFHAAPRGTLSHWVVIEDAKIKNYQAVVPSTWNAGPRDADGQPGPYESSLLDNPVADPEQPVEVLRTVHFSIPVSPAQSTCSTTSRRRSSRSRHSERGT